MRRMRAWLERNNPALPTISVDRAQTSKAFNGKQLALEGICIITGKARKSGVVDSLF